MDTVELVERARQGDNVAFGMLVERYWRFAVGVAFSHIGNLADAEDIAQDAFITAFVTLEKLKEPSKFFAWVRAIVVNSAKMFIRSMKLLPNGLLHEDTNKMSVEESPERIVLQQELVDQVNHEISSLPVNYREVVVLKYFTEMKYQEISNTINIPVTTVSYRLRHATSKLKKELASLMEGYSERTEQNVRLIDQITTMLSEGCSLDKAGYVTEAEDIFDRASRLAVNSPGLHIHIACKLTGLFTKSGYPQRLAKRIVEQNELALSQGWDGDVWNGDETEPYLAYSDMAVVYMRLGETEKANEMVRRAEVLGNYTVDIRLSESGNCIVLNPKTI